MPVTTVKKLPHDSNYNKLAIIVGRDKDTLEYEYVDIDSQGRTITRNVVWDPDTLSWVASTGSLASGSEVEVTNFPASQVVVTQDGTAKYKISDMDVASDPSYFGYVDSDGNWYIMELNDASGTARYVKGSSGYTTAWTNRASQTYGYYNAIF